MNTDHRQYLRALLSDLLDDPQPPPHDPDLDLWEFAGAELQRWMDRVHRIQQQDAD